VATQGSLLKRFSDGVDAFLKDLEAKGRADEVAVLAFSEFGRRVAENGSAGTDHGAAAPVILVGHGLKGGVMGAHPSLVDLTSGDLKFSIDFRDVYAALLREWMDGDPQTVLGGDYSRVSLVDGTLKSESGPSRHLMLPMVSRPR
jgi:uncharacterized protein (DUF1501 family)